MQRVFLPLSILVLFFVGAGYYILNIQNSSGPRLLPQGKVCEPDSLVCEDGTILKRQTPECNFPPCPSNESELNVITVIGTTTCLPHKQSEGPQTLECALGIETEDGNNYAVNDPGWKFLIGRGTGAKVKIEGKFRKSQDSKYDSVGIIEIVNLTEL